MSRNARNACARAKDASILAKKRHPFFPSTGKPLKGCCTRSLFAHDGVAPTLRPDGGQVAPHNTDEGEAEPTSPKMPRCLSAPLALPVRRCRQCEKPAKVACSSSLRATNSTAWSAAARVNRNYVMALAESTSLLRTQGNSQRNARICCTRESCLNGGRGVRDTLLRISDSHRLSLGGIFFRQHEA